MPGFLVLVAMQKRSVFAVIFPMHRLLWQVPVCPIYE